MTENNQPWNSDKKYTFFDSVVYNGAIYYALRASQGLRPDIFNEDWFLAKKNLVTALNEMQTAFQSGWTHETPTETGHYLFRANGREEIHSLEMRRGKVSAEDYREAVHSFIESGEDLEKKKKIASEITEKSIAASTVHFSCGCYNDLSKLKGHWLRIYYPDPPKR